MLPLSLLLLVGTVTCLGAVGIFELPLLDGLTHLEEVADGLEQGLILATREGSWSIIISMRSPRARDPSSGGADWSERGTVLWPRIAPLLGRLVRCRRRKPVVTVPLA